MLKTTNYNLNKPEVTDPMRLADFNDNANKIDAALGNLNAAVSTKAEQSAVEALSTALAGRKRVAVGSYIGDNTTQHTIPLEFTPQFVLVVSQFNEKPCLLIATSGMGLTFNGSSFVLSNSRCVENGIYILGNANYSKEGNYYLAVE